MTKKITKQALRQLIESMVKKQLSEGPEWKPGMPIPPVQKGKGRYDPDKDWELSNILPKKPWEPEPGGEFKTDFDVFVNGKFYPFFGAQNNMFKMGKSVFEAVEDEDHIDGKTSMEDIIVVSEPVSGFFGQPIAEVQVIKQDEYQGTSFQGYALVDKSNHAWLTFGTNNYDDYYPLFIFDYDPPR